MRTQQCRGAAGDHGLGAHVGHPFAHGEIARLRLLRHFGVVRYISLIEMFRNWTRLGGLVHTPFFFAP